jgi:AcrR family transcriptional regulator
MGPYHQFRDKVALFEAVFEDVERGVVEKLYGEVEGLSDPFRILRRGFDAFLDVCLDPAVGRIALIDAPAVLGWERWRELEQAYGLGMAKVALQAAMDAGVLKRQAVDPLAHVLFGAVIEAGLLVANSPDPAVTRREVGKPVQALLDALRAK